MPRHYKSRDLMDSPPEMIITTNGSVVQFTRKQEARHLPKIGRKVTPEQAKQSLGSRDFQLAMENMRLPWVTQSTFQVDFNAGRGS